ncbi:unnamed protein product [Prunus armeniaca]
MVAKNLTAPGPLSPCRQPTTRKLKGGGGHCPSSLPLLISPSFSPIFPFLLSLLLLSFPSPYILDMFGFRFVTSIVFVSAATTVVKLDCVSHRESCDTWWLMFCLCFNGGGSIDAGGSCWNVVLFSTLCRSKSYTWS